MLISYKNNEQLKKDFLKQIAWHKKQDAIVQGTYGRRNGKWVGCAVACSLRSLAIMRGDTLVASYSNHKDYEEYLGVPEWLARLEDTIFEGLPKEAAKKWPEQFAKAIPVGKDLNPIKWHFCVFLMKENIKRVLTLNISDELKKQEVDAIRQVLAVHEKAIKTGEWDKSAAESAGSAAGSALGSAAGSAVWSAESAESAESVGSALGSAVWSIGGSTVWSAAKSAAYQKYAKKLLSLLRKA